MSPPHSSPDPGSSAVPRPLAGPGSSGSAESRSAVGDLAVLLLALVVIAAIGGAAYGLISGRFDYAAHYAAGAGGELMVLGAGFLSLVFLRGWAVPGRAAVEWLVVIATIAVIGLGIVIEHRRFGYPVADWLDIVHQSLGAAFMALIVLLIARIPRSTGIAAVQACALGVLGAALVVIGAVVVGLI